MNTQIQTTQKSRGTEFIENIFTVDRMPVVENACSGNRFATPDKIKGTMAEAVMRNPDLFDCSPISLFTSCMLAARLDLDASGHHNGAAFIPRWAGRDKPKECTIQLGYNALVDLATRDGRIRSFTVNAVYKNDRFEFRQGTQQVIDHEPAPERDEGENPEWVYAIARYPDGGFEFEVMSYQEVCRIRDKFATNSKGEVKSPAWLYSFAEMAKKTVLRRLIKRLPVNPVLAEAIHESDSADGYSFDRKSTATTQVASLDGRVGNELPEGTGDGVEIVFDDTEPAVINKQQSDGEAFGADMAARME